MADIKHKALDHGFDCALMFLSISKHPSCFLRLASWLWSKEIAIHIMVFCLYQMQMWSTEWIPKRKRGIQRNHWDLWYILNLHGKHLAQAVVQRLLVKEQDSVVKSLILQTSSEEKRPSAETTEVYIQCYCLWTDFMRDSSKIRSK